jgi:hypothetical protein
MELNRFEFFLIDIFERFSGVSCFALEFQQETQKVTQKSIKFYKAKSTISDEFSTEFWVNYSHQKLLNFDKFPQKNSQ